MKSTLNLIEGMAFDCKSDSNTIRIDAKSPLGKSSGMTPKELLGVGLGGCTAMDVVALLKKHKQSYSSFSVEVDIEPIPNKHPVVFQKADVHFKVIGSVDPSILLESVKLSQTKFCGVSAMLLKAFPIYYHVFLNNELIGEGEANFANT